MASKGEGGRPDHMRYRLKRGTGLQRFFPILMHLSGCSLFAFSAKALLFGFFASLAYEAFFVNVEVERTVLR